MAAWQEITEAGRASAERMVKVAAGVGLQPSDVTQAFADGSYTSWTIM
jgi:hypothetical protein